VAVAKSYILDDDDDDGDSSSFDDMNQFKLIE